MTPHRTKAVRNESKPRGHKGGSLHGCCNINGMIMANGEPQLEFVAVIMTQHKTEMCTASILSVWLPFLTGFLLC